ncbi:NAD-dependent epimerase/dehydratase family protein [Streptomyces sp. NPDC093970]|uniref:NAD-dependent epimerase/dehydratase family protein n=1 Tax=Streptomyces sp. NPDC093970 TaxID=3155076 RepID=UPI003417BCDD
MDACGETAVAVTGGTGFVGSHLVRRLLERDRRVHATVRDASDAARVRPLWELQEAFPGRLALFEADLLKDGSFDEAFRGCATVFHVASPFLMPERIKDGRRDVVDPAVLGTRNVLASVDRVPDVATVVLTSTVGTIFGDYRDVREMAGGILTEEYFNTTSTVAGNPYHYAKTAAERAARDAAAAQDRWRLVTVNPGLVLGPSLTPASRSGSLFLLDELFRGYFCYGAPDFSFTTADVRDVADAHIAAAEHPAAGGRYIVANETMTSFLEMSRIIRTRHPWDPRLPRTALPHWPVRILGPSFGLTQDYIRKHLGIRFRVDNSRGVRELGLTYRPVEQTLLDHHESWRSRRRRA